MGERGGPKGLTHTASGCWDSMGLAMPLAILARVQDTTGDCTRGITDDSGFNKTIRSARGGVPTNWSNAFGGSWFLWRQTHNKNSPLAAFQ
jgi:hypothetical protein